MGLCLNHLSNKFFHPPRYGGHFLVSKHPYCKSTSKKIKKMKIKIFYFFFIRFFHPYLKILKKFKGGFNSKKIFFFHLNYIHYHCIYLNTLIEMTGCLRLSLTELQKHSVNLNN